MVWYFNFCNYFLPNDPVFNNNRMLMFVLMGAQALFYAVVRIVAIHYQGAGAFKAKLKKKAPVKTVKPGTGDEDQQDGKDEKVKEQQESTPEKQKTEQNKSSSQQNQSAVHLNRNGIRTSDDQIQRPSSSSQSEGKMAKMFATLDFLNFQRTFADYFGHHAVAVAMCSIFCPMYFVTLASLVYFILGVFCFFFHGFKYDKTSLGLFIVTIILNVCMFFTALVNVGLLNFDSESNMCYATEDFSKYTNRRR